MIEIILKMLYESANVSMMERSMDWNLPQQICFFVIAGTLINHFHGIVLFGSDWLSFEDIRSRTSAKAITDHKILNKVKLTLKLKFFSSSFEFLSFMILILYIQNKNNHSGNAK